MPPCAEGPARNQRGFLLLEALVALAIVGVVAVALLAATGGQLRTADRGSVLLTASALAHDRAVTFRVLDAEALASPPDSLLAGTFPDPFEAFTWEAEIAPVEGEYDLFALRVVVEGRGARYPLDTMLHRAPADIVITPTTFQANPPPPPGPGAGGGGGGGP